LPACRWVCAAPGAAGASCWCRPRCTLIGPHVL
jgi:hypothetical protein